MIASLSRAFNAYSRNVFGFVWGSFLYIAMLLVFILAVAGIGLVYFMVSAAADQPVDIQSMAAILVIGLLGIVLGFFLSGLKGAYGATCLEAMDGRKVSLVGFFAMILQRAPTMFGISLLRSLVWLLLVGPALVIYMFALSDIEYTDLAVGLYSAFMTFVIHMVFAPAGISASAFGTGLFSSLKNIGRIIKRKHVMFAGLYAIYAFTWILCFVPVVQLFSIFLLYPVAYSALIEMVEDR